MENAGVRPHAMFGLLICSFFGSGNFNIVTFFPKPLTLQVVMSPYPLAYIRPMKGSAVVSMIAIVDSPHSTFTAKQNNASQYRKYWSMKFVVLF